MSDEARAEHDAGACEGPPSPRAESGYAGSPANRIALGLGLALGALATVLVVLGESIRLLRLGVLAALWAALIGGLLAVRYRRESAARAAELTVLHQHAEPPSPRGEIERDVDREVDRNEGELGALRAEVAALRQRLEELVRGDVLVERIGMLAETTRMRRVPGAPPGGKTGARTPAAAWGPAPRRNGFPPGPDSGLSPRRADDSGVGLPVGDPRTGARLGTGSPAPGASHANGHGVPESSGRSGAPPPAAPGAAHLGNDTAEAEPAGAERAEISVAELLGRSENARPPGRHGRPG